MIGSQDTWILMPTVDLYDTLMMLAAVNAAKDMYNRSEERIKEFNEKYGDFTTPIIADQDWYNKEMLGKVYGTINDIYAKGGDPLRNSQDRLRVSMMLNRLPYGEYARKKLRAENAKEYYKNMATLIANDKYDESFSRFLGEDPNQWAANSPGITSPSVFKDLKASTDPWMEDLEPTDLGLDPTGMYRMSGITNDQIRGALSPYLSDFINTNRGRYFYSQAKTELLREGNNNPTDAEIIGRLQDNIVTSLHPRTKIKYDSDDFAKLRKQHEYQIAEDNNEAANQIKVYDHKAATDYTYDTLALVDTNRDGIASPEELRNYQAIAKYGKGNASKEAEQLSYIDDVRDSALTSISGNTGNPYISLKPNLDNLFQEAWINAGLTVNPNNGVWKNRTDINKQLNDILKNQGRDAYRKKMKQIASYMENKLAVSLKPAAFLPDRTHVNDDLSNPEAIVFDPSIDLNKIVGIDDAILDGYGSVVGVEKTSKDGKDTMYKVRPSSLVGMKQWIDDVRSVEGVKDIRFRSTAKLVPMFNNKDKKVHFYSKIKIYGVNEDGKPVDGTSRTEYYDWDSLESDGRNNNNPKSPMTNLDYGYKNITSGMIESMAANKLYGAKLKYESDDPQLLK